MVTRWPLVLGVGGQHTLEAHADTFHSLYRRPTRLAQKIKADDAVAVNVWVHRDSPGCLRGGWECDKLDFWGLCKKTKTNTIKIPLLPKVQFRWFLTNGVFGRESKLESVCLIFVERVVIEDFDVHLPFFQTVGFHNRNAGRNVVFDLPTDETLDPPFKLSKYKVHCRCEAGGMFVERRAGQGCRSCN